MSNGHFDCFEGFRDFFFMINNAEQRQMHNDKTTWYVLGRMCLHYVPVDSLHYFLSRLWYKPILLVTDIAHKVPQHIRQSVIRICLHFKNRACAFASLVMLLPYILPRRRFGVENKMRLLWNVLFVEKKNFFFTIAVFVAGGIMLFSTFTVFVLPSLHIYLYIYKYVLNTRTFKKITGSSSAA